MKEDFQGYCEKDRPYSLPAFDSENVIRIGAKEARAITGQATPDYSRIASFIAPGKKIFFVGIGGISMCGLAELCQHEGVICSGSDPSSNARTKHLKTLGIKIVHEHRKASIDEARPDLLVYSKAVFDDNPERLRAAELESPLSSGPSSWAPSTGFSVRSSTSAAPMGSRRPQPCVP